MDGGQNTSRIARIDLTRCSAAVANRSAGADFARTWRLSHAAVDGRLPCEAASS